MSSLPYLPISEYYRKQFQAKVYKIPVSISDDCPNRRGIKGMQTCIFCDEWGSAADKESLNMDLAHQIHHYQQRIQKKYKAEKFLVYFQSYTSTFVRLKKIREQFEIAHSFSDVVGFVVGTRPDCLSPALFSLWNEFHEKKFVNIEFGVQSFFDHHLDFLRRGHSGQESINAIKKVHYETGLPIGIHLIFGLPNETDDEIKRTADQVNQLPLAHVKLHHLHVLKGTPLADLYQQGLFTPISLEDYSRRTQIFLESLRPDIYIHRLAAYAPRWDELIAPEWTANKMGTHQAIIDFLNERKSFQGKLYPSLSGF